MSFEDTKNEMMIAPAAMQANTALANIEQSRAVAEVQASMVLARANPRNELAAEHRIVQSCKRKRLAECASYSFRRGGEIVSGVSIRLAEEIARHWGNVQYGFREIGRGDDFSEVEAFAHDLETNVRVTRQFQVRHWRDTKQGGKKITEERDKYEVVANMAQRRVRACLLELLPGDLVEEADEACKATLIGSIGDPAEKAKELVAAFAPFGVTAEMIEGYLQRKLTSIVPADIVNLKRIYLSIKDGIAAADEFFKKDDVEKLNKRFGTPEKVVVTPKAEPTTPPVGSQPPPQEESTTPPVDNRPPPKAESTTPPVGNQPPPQAEPTTPDRVTVDPRVTDFFRDINACQSTIALDTWRMKHHKRLVATFGDNTALYHKVMDYIEVHNSDLVESEKQGKNAPQGGKRESLI